ncbi:MAG: hypothetical protein A3K19_11125 [Lentisphaerae bacterium RIFOXYB12_FULL_65_16]|nr:MAG: hypothetical protein A3K18_32370 [Lentisphaerae bacterium RIFOXYA12_64_32]OGV90785.1 MAG: hypothetical protein A3K19_11125 [Lentisphaerae bacterium RIFOXYB12_FULL_65_16]
MAKMRVQLSTGLPGLDRVFRGLMPGDNIVWRVNAITDYLPFVKPFAGYARENRQKLFYFRFAEHPPLLNEEDGAEIVPLHPANGFDPFLSEVHHTIDNAGRGCLYLFDCLSELAGDWCSDRMLGNFFMLTCPYLYDRAAIAYFSILRNYHSFHAVTPITNTTQILLDAYRHKDKLYIHPIKVQYRHSPTMYMLHAWEGDTFVPVNQSCIITEILDGVPWSRLDAASYQLGYWSKAFFEAEDIQQDLDNGVDREEESVYFFRRLLRMLISHDEPVLQLAQKYFTLKDLLNIRKRMIGTGLIGGKSVGMLLARAILRKTDARWDDIMEVHDSFYVGADVFYTYLVQNGCWWMIQKHKNSQQLDDETETARRRILAGEFPDYIVKQFADMLDYFGQSPIIVRSSSLLEDNFGNAFAGKYESVFCANQGGPHKRLEDFLFAVRTVYASTMGEEALAYRAQRGLLGRDEQMGVLIQRVSGATYGNLFFPQAAGVAFSVNSYVWHDTIDPTAGMLRLVFGVGTRAVDRADDDYTRIVALNAPGRRPEGNFDEVRQYAQRRVDVIDLEGNQLTSMAFEDILKKTDDCPIEMFASRDMALENRMARERMRPVQSWVLTFDKLLSETDFVKDMRSMLSTLHAAYDYPVDVEFTLNFFDREKYRINLVQCRPLQVRGTGISMDPPEDLAKENVLVESHGAVIGMSTQRRVDWMIYVVPSVYGELPVGERYAVARVIAELMHLDEIQDKVIMLLGPGRWGTTTPSLGVPVTFADINSVSVLCEIVAMRDNLVPDVSLGTHFFNELVENDILYMALFPNKEGNRINTKTLETDLPNRLVDLLPDAAEWTKAVRFLNMADLPEGAMCVLSANVIKQRVCCYTAPYREGFDVRPDGDDK